MTMIVIRILSICFVLHHIPLISSSSSTNTPSTQHKIFKWHYNPTPMPKPRSDISATFALAPDDDGDLYVSIYLLGGCDDPNGYTRIKESTNPTISKTSTNDDDEAFVCHSIGSDNMAYDPHLGLFSSRKKMPRPRYRHDAVTVNGMIWAVGGRDANDNPIREIDVYQPQFDSWRYVGDLPPSLATSDLTTYAHGDDLIVIGGYDSNNRAVNTTYLIDTVRTLDQPPSEKRVFTRRLADMGTPRGDINVVTYGRYAYVMGGFTHENGFCEPLRSMEVYDVEGDAWVYLPADLNYGRGDAAVVKYNGKFYVLGGETRYGCESGDVNDEGRKFPVHTVEVYDPKLGYDGRWQVKKMHLPQDEGFRFVAASWPDIDGIFVFGGVSDADIDECDCLKTSDLAVVFRYEPVEGMEWWMVVLLVLGGMMVGVVVRRTLSSRRERRRIDDDEEEEISQLHSELT